MKKFFIGFVCIFSMHAVNSQTISTTPATDSISVSVQPATGKKELNKFDLSNRSNDHIMVQYGFDKWAGTPDS
ncbi:MAG TPA: hypothetical protein VF700_03935, partial [Segetibacter sp.]